MKAREKKGMEWKIERKQIDMTDGKGSLLAATV